MAQVNARDTGDMGSIPGLGRFPLEGNGNPLQGNLMDRGAWRAAVQELQELKNDRAIK